MTDGTALKSSVKSCCGRSQRLSQLPRAPEAQWMTVPGLDYVCAVGCMLPLVLGPKAKFPGREGTSDPPCSSRCLLEPAKSLAYQLCMATEKSRHTCPPLKVSITVFGWFIPVLWVAIDSNRTDGNLIIQVSLPHFVWVTSVFSSLWVQLILKSLGLFATRPLSPTICPGLWSERVPLFFITECQVDLHALGIIQKSPLCHLSIEIHILVFPNIFFSSLYLFSQFLNPTLKIILLGN